MCVRATWFDKSVFSISVVLRWRSRVSKVTFDFRLQKRFHESLTQESSEKGVAKKNALVPMPPKMATQLRTIGNSNSLQASAVAWVPYSRAESAELARC